MSSQLPASSPEDPLSPPRNVLLSPSSSSTLPLGQRRALPSPEHSAPQAAALPMTVENLQLKSQLRNVTKHLVGIAAAAARMPRLHSKQLLRSSCSGAATLRCRTLSHGCLKLRPNLHWDGVSDHDRRYLSDNTAKCLGHPDAWDRVETPAIVWAMAGWCQLKKMFDSKSWTVVNYS